MQANNFRLKHIFEYVQRQDRPLANKCLAEVGLSKADLHSDKVVIDTIKEAQFLRLAFHELGDPTIGAKVGLKYFSSATLPGYIARYSENTAAAIETSARFYSQTDTYYRYSLRRSGNAAAFEIEAADARVAKYHRHNEFLLYGSLTYLRSITESNFFPLEMRFAHEHRSEVKSFARLAGCSVKFGCEKTEMILSNSTLQIPIPTYDPRLRKHLTEYGERLRQEAPEELPSLQALIEGVLTKGLPNRLEPSDEVAASLGLSSRTMARRLTEEGTTFRTIVDDLRFELAKSYLKDKISVTEIAYLLGYSDTAAFSSAFKRWSGEAPSGYQKRKSW